VTDPLAGGRERTGGDGYNPEGPDSLAAAAAARAAAAAWAAAWCITAAAFCSAIRALSDAIFWVST
jgi:hypothetical protein